MDLRRHRVGTIRVAQERRFVGRAAHGTDGPEPAAGTVARRAPGHVGDPAGVFGRNAPLSGNARGSASSSVFIAAHAVVDGIQVRQAAQTLAGQDIAERPRPAGLEVGGRLARGHDGQTRHAFPPVAEHDVVPVELDALDALADAQARIVLRCAAARDAHAVADAVRGLLGAQVDDVHLEVRIGTVVDDHGQRDILAVDGRATLEAREAHVVVNTVLARDDRIEARRRIVDRHAQHFRCRLRSARDDDRLLVEAHAHAHKEPFVRIVPGFGVLHDGRAHAMAPYGPRAPGSVEFRVENPPPVGREATAGSDALDDAGQVVPRLHAQDGPVADDAAADVVTFVAARVRAVQQQRSVLADVHGADGEEALSLGLLIGVEVHLFAGQGPRSGRRVDPRRPPVGLIGHRDAALQTVLESFRRAGEVPPAVHAHRHRQIGLLDTVFELVEERAAQARHRSRPRFCPSVLGINVRSCARRIRVAHPLVVIDEDIAVDGPGLRFLRGGRRIRLRGLRLPAHRPCSVSCSRRRRSWSCSSWMYGIIVRRRFSPLCP